MKVLITGAGGQLGQELLLTAPAGVATEARTHLELDICQQAAVERTLAELAPDLVIHTAAFTAVDQAESEPERAFAINAEGARNLARAATSETTRLIHISTDFIFDGNRGRPYTSQDPPRPLGVYGASKLEGERNVLETTDGRALVLRTAWVYSRFGDNFVKTILRLLEERDALEVVADQVGTPTWARGLAEAVWRAAELPDLGGVHHWTDAGVASWYDFAVAIQEEAAALDLTHDRCEVLPVSSSDRPSKAPRPAFSVLDKTATWQALGVTPPHWRRQLRAMMRDLAEVENG